MSDLYDTYALYQEIEEDKIHVPEDVRKLVMFWILNCCTYYNGEWISGKVFDDLDKLTEAMTAMMIDARDFLPEPEKTIKMAQAFRLHVLYKRIKRQLRERFKDTLINPI